MTKYIYALGFFDGVHLGHRALLRRCRMLAQDACVDTGAVTFANHPDSLVFGKTPGLINTPEDRDVLLQSFGMTRVVSLPFTRELRDTPWRDFLDMLCRDYGAAGFVCGDDFRFGRKGEGNAQLLLEYCREAGIPGAVVPQQNVGDIRVSSTYIRKLLEAGDIARTNRFLGHPHILSGQVINGKHLGRTLGIPTANLAFPSALALPRFGVYACKARVQEGTFIAVTNVGRRPTVNGSNVNAESWLLDFDGDLYGQTLTLEFYGFVRPEMKFGSLEQMRSEIFRNAETARNLLGSL